MNAYELAAGVAWLMDEEHLQQVLRVALREGDVEAVARQLGRPLRNAERAWSRDGVAVLPLVGPMFRRANLLTEDSGATSTELLARDFNAALAGPEVAAIVLDVDSPGGEANGVNEVAGMIHQARGQKPIVAYVSYLGASGAYWIASAADRIVVDATALLGSVGVVSMVVDTSRQDQERGIVRIVSTQSPRKLAEPSTEEGRAEIQQRAGALADVFVDAVARTRGEARVQVLEQFGRGGIVVGRNAVEAGMADSLGSLESVIADLKPRRTPPPARPSAIAAALKETTMTTIPDEPAPVPAGDITATFIAERFPHRAAEFREAGHAAGLEAGAAAERTRIAGIEELALPGYADLAMQAKADPAVQPADFAVRQVREQRRRGEGYLDRQRESERTAPRVAVSTEADRPRREADRSVDPSLPLDERIKAQWERDADLRAEFGGNFELYQSYAAAEEAGQVKRYSPHGRG